MSRIEYRGNNPKPQQNFLLAKIFLTGIVLILVPLLWISNQLSLVLGPNGAQAVLVLGFIIIFLLIGLGTGLWYLVDHAIAQRKSVFNTDTPGKFASFLMLIMGYELVDDEETLSAEEYGTNLGKPAGKVMRKKSRPGRKPTFPLERWLPIAQKWESRDPLVDAFTLGELISEHLGTNADGSPAMTEQSYYNLWRDLALAELERREIQKKAQRKGAVSRKEIEHPIV